MRDSPNRDIVIGIRVNAAEQKSLRALADAERASLSNMFRRRVGLPDGPERADRAEATGQGRRERRA